MSDKAKLATVWLDGCSGCHMSFLDIDERILDVAALADLVYSPLVDLKEFPEMADVTLVEGAVSSEEDYHKIQKVRAHTKILVSLGDCAVTSNVPGMRNPFKVEDVLNRAYLENVDDQSAHPGASDPAAAENVGAGASRGRRRRVRARLPALGGHHLLRTHGTAGRPQTGHEGRNEVWHIERVASSKWPVILIRYSPPATRKRAKSDGQEFVGSIVILTSLRGRIPVRTNRDSSLRRLRSE
jgi:NAD-reducing hydrogenase small subunit